MSDICPKCGAEMVFMPAPSRAESATRCANCEYWEERVLQDDVTVIVCGHGPDGEETWTNGTIVAVGHEAEEGGEMSDAGTCKQSLQVEAKVRPWLRSQQETILAQAAKDTEEYRNAAPDHRNLMVYLGASKDLRWDATLRAVEKQRDALKEELAEVKADRDSWRHCAQHG